MDLGDTRHRQALGLCREMGLWDLGTATADQQVLGRWCPRGTLARTHTEEG